MGGLIGTAGGAGGTGFNTSNPVTNGQIQTGYGGTQDALKSQQDLLNALQNQQGLQNQTQIYGQLQNIASGQGPNPAQAMLNQATGQNIQSQAALQAGQRGAAQNVGLIARQAAQQGAQTQQQAAGQAATMQANQSLNAINQAGNMANAMASNQIGQTNANLTGQSGVYGQLLGAQGAYNTTQGGLAQTEMGGQQGLIGGLLQGGGMAMKGMAEGGQVPDTGSAFPGQSKFGKFLAEAGKSMDESAPTSGAQALQKGMTKFGEGLGQMINKSKGANDPNNNIVQGQTQFNDMVEGSPVQQDSSPLPDGREYSAHGGNIGSKLKSGGHVPGKAKVDGDSLKNDNVKAMLSPGEIVIPRSVVNSRDPVKGSAEFVRAILAKKGKKA